MPKRTTDYRTSLLDDLRDPEEAANYLNAARGESDNAYLLALRDVAEAREKAGTSQRSRDESQGAT